MLCWHVAKTGFLNTCCWGVQVQECVTGQVWHYLWIAFTMQMECVLRGGHENLMTLLASDTSSGVTNLEFCNFAWQVLPGSSTTAAALKSMPDLKWARKPESVVHFFPVLFLHLLNTQNTVPDPSLHLHTAPHSITPSSLHFFSIPRGTEVPSIGGGFLQQVTMTWAADRDLYRSSNLPSPCADACKTHQKKIKKCCSYTESAPEHMQ